MISPEMEAAVRKTIAERDAYKFVLSCIATGDCEDPVKLAREILADGREGVSPDADR